MSYIIKFIYGFVLPPGIFVLFLLIVGILLYRREKLIAKLLFITAFLLYGCTIPLTGKLLIQSLENRYTPPSQIKGDVILMLGGGATLDTPDFDGKGQLSGNGANRLLTVLRLYKQTGLPILLSSGQVFSDSGNESEIAKRELLSLGVPKSKIFLENKSKNTEENAEFSKQLLNKNGWHKPVLVTSAFHMERAVLDFKKNNIDVLPYPTDYQTSRKLPLYANQFTPSTNGLAFLAAKEYLGIFSLQF